MYTKLASTEILLRPNLGGATAITGHRDAKINRPAPGNIRLVAVAGGDHCQLSYQASPSELS